MDTENNSRLRIGALAQAAGVRVDTVRYYERRGLLPEPARTASGYRSYGAETLKRLRFIRQAKQLGFRLEDIRELLALSQDRDLGVAGVKARAEAQLADVERRIDELARMRQALRELISSCPGRGEPGACPILAALSGEHPSWKQP